ncbi:prolyl-tRNA synthetase [Pyronema omphalodes]|nr:prolyl-tRNA synthetase [Pyronema omphalodes]
MALAFRLIQRPSSARLLVASPYLRRHLTCDHRDRLSNVFVPTGGIESKKDNESDATYELLVKAGYLRKAYSGVFHYLPFGHRVHEKLEKLIDKHMRSIGASRLALSTISSEELWTRTGRLEKGGAELMRFQDRKGSKMILSPTHEEEITSLIGNTVKSHKKLPLRVYQIGRKYRDERRPRAGLLRGREFTMKDLYTFDASEKAALQTYEEVRVAYRNLFDELGLPYLVAEADSGAMGGNLSHEYLYPSASGEDEILSCTSCSYTANTEAAVPRPAEKAQFSPSRSEIAVHHAITTDKKTLINTYYLKTSLNANNEAVQNEVNLHRIKEIVPDLDPGHTKALDVFMENFTPFSTEEKVPHSQIINLFDSAIPYPLGDSTFSNHSDHPAAGFVSEKSIPTTSIISNPKTNSPLTLLKPRVDDHCPRCTEGRLKSTTAIELGHTFHLGTRYSLPLNATVANEDQKIVPMEMGCHGIGVSRMIAAIAAGYRDSKGLQWPRVVAPFDAVVVSHPDLQSDAEGIYDKLSEAGVETILDDRNVKDLMWKMKDADLVGYPVMVVLGTPWKKEKLVEVQARRKNFKVTVPLEEVNSTVKGLLADL